MSEPMRLKVEFCEHIGLCPGIRRGLRIFWKTLVYALATFRRVYYKNPPHEAMEMITSIVEKGIPVAEWHPGLSSRAIQVITPFGGPKEAYEGPHADGTCVNVQNIRELAIKWHERGYRVIFVAEHNSSEIEFINTFIEGEGIVVADFEDADVLDLNPQDKVVILGQSSFRRDLFKGIVEVIKGRFPDNEVKAIEALCPEIVRRVEEVKSRVFVAHKKVIEIPVFDDIHQLFPYDAVVMVGSFKSKQMSFMAIELAPIFCNVIWVENENGLGAEQFKPGQRILIASGPEVTPGKLKRVRWRLLRLTSDDLASAIDQADPCGDCIEKERCPRRQCKECKC